jgi:serine/threonine-protein kinase RsbW
MGFDDHPMTLTIPSDLRLLGMARQFVEAVCHTGGVAADPTDAIVLAANEAISNIIRHAHRDRCGAQLKIQCRLLDNGIELVFQDEGAPFDLEAVPHLNPAELRIGGRGVFLMRTLMDDLSCQSIDGGGNVLRMVKHCCRNSSRRECG